MSAEPYTPDETELRDSYAGLMEEQAGEDYGQAKADAERGIAKIKADAWDEGQEALTRDTNHQGKRMRVTPNPYRIEKEA